MPVGRPSLAARGSGGRGGPPHRIFPVWFRPLGRDGPPGLFVVLEGPRAREPLFRKSQGRV
jgi:hypothetical protein